MTLAELKAKLDTSTYPVAYLMYPEEQLPAMPYIVYYVVRESASAGDNLVNEKKKEVSVELYCRDKDETVEAKVETALADFVWTKSETYIIDARCFLITYEIEVV